VSDQQWLFRCIPFLCFIIISLFAKKNNSNNSKTNESHRIGELELAYCKKHLCNSSDVCLVNVPPQLIKRIASGFGGFTGASVDGTFVGASEVGDDCGEGGTTGVGTCNGTGICAGTGTCNGTLLGTGTNTGLIVGTDIATGALVGDVVFPHIKFHQ
jgi:hypothetical protein